MGRLKWNETLGRKVRDEPWEELTVSTYRRIRDAIGEGRVDDAVEYVEYFHEEALVHKRMYDQWIRDSKGFMGLKGFTDEELGELTDRLNRMISLDEGDKPWDRERGWTRYVELKDSLIDSIRTAGNALADSAEGLHKHLFDMKEASRVGHDLDVDFMLGLYDALIDKSGEEAVGEMWEKHVILDWFKKRYVRFDVSKNDWAEFHPLLVFLSFEAMHGHLCGPGREGDVEFREFEDRIELQFDPCGTGGRTYRGEPLEGTSSRMEAPYNFKPIRKAHDFTWNKEGICTYCVHCCVLTEKLPAQTFGYPVRVIDPPSYPHNAQAKCRYTIYKDLRDIPEHIYQRIGLNKPAPDQPLGSDHGPYR